MTTQFTLPSRYDGLPISVLTVSPSDAPKKIVQFVHGMAERKERYLEIMEFLAEKGYLCVCNDHRGHGESVKEEADLGWFGDYDGKAIVEDTVMVTEHIKAQYPDLPVVLFGHSMGSLVVRCCVQAYDRLYEKLVVCGSPSKNPLAGTAIALEKCIRLFKGARHRSGLLKQLSTGKGNAPFEREGANAWLSRNRESVEAYEADPKCGFIFTCNGYENLFKLLKRTYRKKSYKVENPAMRVHFMAGGDDPVIVNEVKWLKAIEFMRSRGYTVTGRLYEGMRHEILNEIGREEVYADLVSFLENA